MHPKKKEGWKCLVVECASLSDLVKVSWFTAILLGVVTEIVTENANVAVAVAVVCVVVNVYSLGCRCQRVDKVPKVQGLHAYYRFIE
jgi:hypothetical protein